MIAGSGLRDGDANISAVAPYAQFNAGIAREFLLPDDPKPMTVRFDVVNLFDSIYLIRDGSGIGVFAPQYGPRGAAAVRTRSQARRPWRRQRPRRCDQRSSQPGERRHAPARRPRP